MDKPLGRKAYGSIPHIPGSRMGPADHACSPGQARIATERVRDKHDKVWIQEKLDGSCVAVAKINGDIIALGRAGYPAWSSPFEQHHLFADWVNRPEQLERFHEVLVNGERLVGEWLAQAHGTRYDLVDHDPFVPFDIMVEAKRLAFLDFENKMNSMFVYPYTFGGPMPPEHAMESLGEYGQHRSLEPIEGVVYRVERKGEVDFLVKYVRPDKVDGLYLPEISGKEAVWNWRP